MPPRGIWGKSAQATWLTADAWLARPPAGPSSGGSAVERLLVRYLAAFGPASVADAQT